MSENTPHPDAGARGGTQVVVDDPEDFAQTRRLRSIYNAREYFQKKLAKIRQHSRDGSDLYKREEILQNAFIRYFFEVEPLMEQHPNGDHYLDEIDLGEIVPDSRADDVDMGDKRVFHGLRDLTRKYKPLPVPSYDIYGNTDGARDTVGYSSIPVESFKQGFREINRFLAEVGLDAQIAPDRADAKFDYSDLLDADSEANAPPQIEADGGRRETS